MFDVEGGAVGGGGIVDGKFDFVAMYAVRQNHLFPDVLPPGIRNHAVVDILCANFIDVAIEDGVDDVLEFFALDGVTPPIVMIGKVLSTGRYRSIRPPSRRSFRCNPWSADPDPYTRQSPCVPRQRTQSASHR